jgi:hemerythrin superfamily protein
MDAIELLEQQHRDAEALFDRFENTQDDEQQREIVTQVLRELRMHTSIEEEFLYPAAQERVQGLEDELLEAYEEHHAVELLMDELDGMSPDDERFDAKVTVVKELVLHHVEEEEQELFPEIRDTFSEDELAELGEQMAARAEELGSDTADATKEELYARAQELDIQGRSTMSKRQLANAVRRAS